MSVFEKPKNITSGSRTMINIIALAVVLLLILLYLIKGKTGKICYPPRPFGKIGDIRSERA